MDITIREYRHEDCATLIELFRGSVRLVARRDYNERQILAWAPDDIDADLFARKRAGKPTWIAELGGQIVGFTDLEPDGHIDMLFVHAEHQGQGVARTLLAHVENFAKCRGMTRLYTEASITARPVFERKGFVVIIEQTVVVRGVPLTNFRMEKRLF